MMRKKIALFLCVTAVIGSPVLADTDLSDTAEPPIISPEEAVPSKWMPGIFAGVDVANSYVVNGVTYNDGLVIQPWVGLSLQSFGFNVWANYDVDDYNGNVKKNELSEIDFCLNYAFSMGPVDSTIGYTFWTYPNAGTQADQVATLDISYALIKSLRLGVLGEYRTAGTTKETWQVKPYANLAFQLTDHLSLGFLGEVGYLDFGGHDCESGWMYYNIGSQINYRMLSLSAKYVGRIDKDILPTGEFGYDRKMLLTAGVSFAF